MGDVIFVVVVMAFFALSVAYVKGCERIVGRDTGVELPGDTDTEDVPESTLGTAQ